MANELKRICHGFERLKGKSVLDVGYGGQFLWMIFADGTFIFLDAHSYSMSYDSEIEDYWKVQIGLLSQENWDRQEAARKKRIADLRESEERKVLAELKAKYEQSPQPT